MIEDDIILYLDLLRKSYQSHTVMLDHKDCEEIAHIITTLQKHIADIHEKVGIYEREVKLLRDLKNGVYIEKKRYDSLLLNYDRYQQTMKRVIKELSIQLSEASFLSHEQRYKASCMVDDILEKVD